MNSVPEVVDKTQNFAAHKDEFLKDIYSNKRSIVDIVIARTAYKNCTIRS